MSLINKMLKDLETRQSAGQRPDAESIYAGLRAPKRPPAGRRALVLSAVVAGLVLAGTAGWFVWQRIGSTPPEMPVPAQVEVIPPLAPPVTTARKPAMVAKPVRPAVAPSPKSDAATSAIELNSRPLTSDDQAENKYREGLALIRQARLEDAEARLRAALAINPTHVQARESLAALLVEQGRWLEGQAVLEDGLRILPNQVSFGFLLARLYVEQGKDAAGLQLLERLQPQSGNNPDFIAFMAALYQRTARHDEAVRYFRQATAARATEAQWWVGLGISLEAINERGDARAAYLRANALPMNPRLAEYVAERLKLMQSR